MDSLNEDFNKIKNNEESRIDNWLNNNFKK
jgi:hypothetical protein